MANGTGNKGSSTGIEVPISTQSSDKQTVSIIDLISEGPIYGLVDGAASTFLNNDRIVERDSAAKSFSRTGTTITLTNGSTSATLNRVLDYNLISPYNGASNNILVRAGKTTNVTAAYSSRKTQTLNTSSSFFNANMVTNPEDVWTVVTSVPCRLRGISGTSTTPDGLPIEGFLYAVDSSTSARWKTGSTGSFIDYEIPNGTYSLEVDEIVEITGHSGTSVTLSQNWTGVSGTYSFDYLGWMYTFGSDIDWSGANYDSATVNFRTGTLLQTPFSGKGNLGSTAKTQSLNLSLEKSTDFGGDQPPRELLGSSSTGFGLSAAQLEEVDLVQIRINYPGGLKALSTKGKDRTNHIRYKFQVKLKQDGVWGNYFTIRDDLIHKGMISNATTFESVFSLEQFRPFEDFEIKISRKDAHDGDAFGKPGVTYGDWTNISTATITGTTSIFNEKLSYPYTSLAKVSFNSKEFQQIPQRTYHVKGLLVQVPSNYVTRDEASNSIASYNRNVSTGAIESSYQDWDGNFRDGLVYTNNPAWIFYDILKNNRYGLGSFISADEIDKFALYRIARYCDELVDDGKGGQEPRYTLNTYLTKEATAYKVLKDLTTNFLGMLYFLDGKILTTLDAPASSVYNFTKANVIDGAFSYESTGSKTRINQVIVQWNNPDNNYALEPLIVEDKRNIAKTQKIITETAVAVGCTSEGQASRYGKWKLWTAANQQEVVSFSTGINGSYITPGDIINIQDADRYTTRYGGRISNTGTLSTTVVPLDSDVTLNSGSTYKLDVIIVEPAAFLTQASSATIGGTVYNTGDLVPSVDTEAESYNTTDDSGNPVSLSWKDHFRTESRTVSTSAGTVSSLTVSTAFSEAPSREDMWVLTETKQGLTVQGSAKQYKVLSIAQSSKNIYDITAAEHYNEKYSAIEEDFTTYVPEALAQIVKATDIVPEVIDASSSLILEGDKEVIKLQWIPPASTDRSVRDEDGNIISVNVFDRYEFLHGFEISHNIPTYPTPIRVDKDRTEFRFRNIEEGEYIIAVRAINILENKSSPKTLKIETRPDFQDVLTRFPGNIPVGGLASVNTSISSGGTFGFASNIYGYKPPQPNGASFSSTTTTPADYQQDCSDLTITTVTGNSGSGEFVHEHHYILFQSDLTTNPLRLMKYNKTAAHKVPYWFDAGTGNETTGLTGNLSGTVTKAANRSVVTGSGTSFTSELAVGALFVVGNEASIVSFIDSDTTLYLDRASTTAYSGDNYKTNNYHVDYTNDAIIARVYKTSSGFFSESFTGLDTSLTPQQAITRTIYRKNSSVIDDDVGTFSDPLAGNTDWSLGVPALTADGDIVYASTRTLTSDGKSPQDTTWSTPVVYAQRADGVDGTNGTDGTDAYTVILTNEAHTLPTTNTGTVTYTDSGTTISVFKGTTQLDATSGTPASGEFSVSASGSNITPGGITTSGDPVVAVVADHSNMTATNATVTYTINLENSITATKTQSLAKSVEGADGIDGTNGTDGDDGLRTIQGYLYYEKTTAGAPSAPSGNIYTFSTGLVSGSGVGTGENIWTNSPRPQDPTSTNTHYTIRYYGTEASPNSSTISVTYSSVVQYTNFTGVVTFSDGTFSQGSDTLYVSSLLPRSDESEWDLGEVTGTRGIWDRNGSGGDENTIVLEEGPHGDTSKIWKSISTDGSGPDGGFQNTASANRFDITDDTVYRFTCFVKQSQADGTIYFGAYNYNSSGTNIGLLDYDGQNSNTNKYWFSADLPTFNEWYLFVGFINPAGTSINSGKGGFYKVDTGVKATSINDFRFNSSADYFAVRTYLFYSSTGSGTIARWAHPRVDRLDKAYPSIEQLLKPIGTGDVNSAVTSIDGGVIQAGSTIEVGATGNNRAGLTGTAADGTGSGQQDTDVRVYSGSTFSNRANAPFRVTQEGEIRAEFGTIGGFSVGIDSLISNSENPLITLGSDLTSNPEKQITLSARAEDDFLLYAGIAVPTDGTGIKQSDNPPFSVDEDGNVIMRSFELRDDANVTLLDSTNLLSDVLVSQIGASLGGGIAAVSFDESTPNNHFELQLSEAQNVQIDFEIDSGGPHVSGVTTSISDALNSIMPQVAVEVEYRVKGTSTWNTFGSVTFTGVKQAGSQPTLSSTQYWINAESYTARTMATYYRSQIEFGYGCITDQGNFQGSVQQENLAANTYEVRINSLTTTDKNITVTARTHNPTGTYVLDYGYGVYGTQSTTGAQVINSPRNFTVKSYASGGYLKKDKWNVTIGSSPKVVKDSVTFADFLPLGGGTMLGPITLEDTVTGGVVFPSSTGPDMIMFNTSGSGYNHIFFRTETASPTVAASLDSFGNLVLGNDLTMGRDLDVQGTTSPTWSYNTSPVSYVSITQEGSLHTDGGLSVTGDAIINNDVFIHGPLVLGWSASRPGEIIFQNAQQGTNKMSILYGPTSPGATTKFLDIQYNDVSEFRFESDGDFHADGNITAYSATISSDEKLKDNIEVIEGALDTLEGIKGVTFEWKKDGKKAGGVIAQDVEKVFPQAVSETTSVSTEETYKTVDYNQIIGILIEAVKDQQTIIDALEKRVSGLEQDDV